jgi:carnosine N-methyltransferase
VEQRPPADQRVRLRVQLVRDWSEEGSVERDLCYRPILDELVARLPVTEDNLNQLKVLVPGAGLGRLTFEIACRGYIAQGNEFSYHMLITGSLVLNRLGGPRSVAIHPWIDQTCNAVSSTDTLRPVAIPDINTAEMLRIMNPDADMSMVAGEFIDVYGKEPNSWDCVVTCFFLDTAANPIEYIETIHRILRPGGLWINLGPLLYHWADRGPADTDVRYDQSLELSYAEIRHVMLNMGFKFLVRVFACSSVGGCIDTSPADVVTQREGTQRVQYTTNVRSLMRTVYNGIFFTARKSPDDRLLDTDLDESTRKAIAAALAQVAEAHATDSRSRVASPAQAPSEGLTAGSATPAILTEPRAVQNPGGHGRK